MTQAIDRYAAYLEALSPEALDQLERFVACDVVFQDPFNAVTGVDAMRQVFQHMYHELGDVRFIVTDAVAGKGRSFLYWRFESSLRGRPWAFEGTSVIEFGSDGLVVRHEDHWDAARAFYERLPVLGWFLRRIRRAIAID